MTDILSLDEGYSTTRLLTQEKPEIINTPEDKFETVLFLPEGENRKGEGGLRTKGYFKKSFDDKPLISIITVVFNGEKYLEETIQSVINQTYSNVEYIIIDGGSSDGTLDIIKKYEERIDYWVSEKDRGIYDAMNKGIKLCSGDIVGLINSDDWYEKDIFKEVINYFYNNDTDILCGNINYVKENKTIVENINSNLYKMNYRMSICHPSVFVKKAIYNKYLYDTAYSIASDYDFLLKLMVKKYKFSYLNKTIANMRMGGISYKNKIIGENEQLQIIKNNFRNNLLKLSIVLVIRQASLIYVKYIKKLIK